MTTTTTRRLPRLQSTHGAIDKVSHRHTPHLCPPDLLARVVLTERAADRVLSAVSDAALVALELGQSGSEPRQQHTPSGCCSRTDIVQPPAVTHPLTHLLPLSVPVRAAYFHYELYTTTYMLEWWEKCIISQPQPTHSPAPPPTHSLPASSLPTSSLVPLGVAVAARRRTVGYAGTGKQLCRVPLLVQGLEAHPRGRRATYQVELVDGRVQCMHAAVSRLLAIRLAPHTHTTTACNTVVYNLDRSTVAVGLPCLYRTYRQLLSREPVTCGRELSQVGFLLVRLALHSIVLRTLEHYQLVTTLVSLQLHLCASWHEPHVARLRRDSL